MMCIAAHHEINERNPFKLDGVHRARLKVLEALWFSMLSHSFCGLF